MHDSSNSLGILLIVFLIIFSSKLTKFINQPSIIGEIIIGVIFINVLKTYHHELANQFLHNELLKNLAILGSIFLLLEIGLETEFIDLVANKKYAILVALTGVVIPFICGYFVVVPIILMNPSKELQLFMGSFFAVTSTGISISLFKELGVLQTTASKIVLGASIIDDIIGLLLLSICISIIKFGDYSIGIICSIVLKVLLFFVFIYLFNKYILKYIFRLFIKNHDNLFILVICCTLFFAYLADKIGLAIIIGAFLSGISINNSYKNETGSNFSISLISPLKLLFTPIFFIYSGMQIDITNILDYRLILLSIIIGILAIVSKLLSSVFIPSHINRKIVGFGMVPRGEIGLIFAVAGFNLSLYSNELFSILMLVIIYTTIITPIAINYIIKKLNK